MCLHSTVDYSIGSIYYLYLVISTDCLKNCFPVPFLLHFISNMQQLSSVTEYSLTPVYASSG